MKSRRQVLQFALAGAGLAAAAGYRPAYAQSWGGSAADEQAIGKLYDTAVAAGESELVIYGAYTSIFRPIWELFTKRFAKIAIVGNPVNGAQLAAKLDAEYASGQHQADIVTSGLTELMAAVDQKRAALYTPPNIASLPARYRDPQGRFVINYAELFGVVYNTEKMKAADVPHTPADLLAPRYKGLLIDEPGSSRVSDLVWIELLNSGKIDAAWIKAMKAQATVVPSLTPFFNQLTTGTIAMIPWGGHARYLGLKQAGAPVAFSATPGLAVPVLAGTVVLNKAPHPNAARLFQAWFLTTEAQNAIVTLGNSYGLTPTVQLPANEADWPKLGPIAEALKAVSPEQYMEGKATLAKVVEASFK
jgi:iron(III) transport system substrate-binding protein